LAFLTGQIRDRKNQIIIVFALLVLLIIRDILMMPPQDFNPASTGVWIVILFNISAVLKGPLAIILAGLLWFWPEGKGTIWEDSVLCSVFIVSFGLVIAIALGISGLLPVLVPFINNFHTQETMLFPGYDTVLLLLESLAGIILTLLLAWIGFIIVGRYRKWILEKSNSLDGTAAADNFDTVALARIREFVLKGNIIGFLLCFVFITSMYLWYFPKSDAGSRAFAAVSPVFSLGIFMIFMSVCSTLLYYASCRNDALLKADERIRTRMNRYFFSTSGSCLLLITLSLLIGSLPSFEPDRLMWPLMQLTVWIIAFFGLYWYFSRRYALPMKWTGDW
jgi:hypothetical protein